MRPFYPDPFSLLKNRCPKCEGGDLERTTETDVRCRTCDFLITYNARDNCWDARLEKESLPEFGIQWRLWSEGRFGDTHILYGKNAQDDFADLLKTIDLTTDDIRGLRLLEVGFGHGRILKEFQRVTETAFGLDLAKPLLSAGLAQRSVVCGDLFAIPFQPRQFDIVVCRGVIMCTKDAERAFSKVAEQVSVGGLLYVYVYEPLMPRSLVLRSLFPGVWNLPVAARVAISRIIGFLRAIARILKERISSVGLFRQYYGNYVLKTFDVISPRITTTHKPDEIHAWFHRHGFQSTRVSPCQYVGRLR